MTAKLTCPLSVKLMTLCLLLLSVTAAHAVIEIAPLSSAEREARYRVLIEELRCPKCQNQNLADSSAPIAADLREQVRTLLEEGHSDDEIVAYLVDRYGEFVRYRPALNMDTAVLWLAPGALLLVGVVTIVLVVRRSPRRAGLSGPLSASEKQQLAALLGPGDDEASHDGSLGSKGKGQGDTQ